MHGFEQSICIDIPAFSVMYFTVQKEKKKAPKKAAVKKAEPKKTAGKSSAKAAAKTAAKTAGAKKTKGTAKKAEQ